MHLAGSTQISLHCLSIINYTQAAKYDKLTKSFKITHACILHSNSHFNR